LVDSEFAPVNDALNMPDARAGISLSYFLKSLIESTAIGTREKNKKEV
jgi:hypothetical protein